MILVGGVGCVVRKHPMPDTTYMCLLLRQVFLLYLLVLCHQHHFQWQLLDDLQRKECVRARAAVHEQDEV